MCGSILCVAVVAVGLEFGYQPLPEGGMEYILQLEPETLRLLSENPGYSVLSDIPPQVRELRRYRIIVGTGPLPKRCPPQPVTPVSANRKSPPQGIASRLFLNTLFSQTLAGRQPSVPHPPSVAAASPSDQLPGPLPGIAEADRNPPLSWTLTFAGLLGAVAGMIYLGWVAWDYRVRYRKLLSRLLDTAFLPDPQ